MDQRRIAGVGNIYADEALFRARLHPLRAAGSVGPREALRLHAAVLETLQAGIDHEGSSIESFIDPAGQRGSFQEILSVYQRTGEPCRVCGTTVERVVVGGRGTHYCPRCQPRRGGMAAGSRRLARRDAAAALGQAGRLGGAGPVTSPAPAPDGPAGSPAARRRPASTSSSPASRAAPRCAVGSLGVVTLERGWYAYVGSALRAREARVARHLAREKPLRWHADYLFTAFPAERAWLVDGAAGECELAGALAAVAGAERRPRRFGAGDCRCAGHLVRLPRRPLRRDIVAAAHAAGAPERGAVRAFSGPRPA